MLNAWADGSNGNIASAQRLLPQMARYPIIYHQATACMNMSTVRAASRIARRMFFDGCSLVKAAVNRLLSIPCTLVFKCLSHVNIGTSLV
jgi:hypothetical protein